MHQYPAGYRIWQASYKKGRISGQMYCWVFLSRSQKLSTTGKNAYAGLLIMENKISFTGAFSLSLTILIITLLCLANSLWLFYLLTVLMTNDASQHSYFYLKNKDWRAREREREKPVLSRRWRVQVPRVRRRRRRDPAEPAASRPASSAPAVSWSATATKTARQTKNVTWEIVVRILKYYLMETHQRSALLIKNN